MKKNIAIVMTLALLVGNILIIKSLLRKSSDLTTIKGVIERQYMVHHEGRNAYKGIILSLAGEKLQYFIDDDKEGTFDYLSTHNSVGKQIEISYDAKAYQDNNLTSFVFGLKVGGNTIMTLKEAQNSLWMLALYMLIIDGVLLGIYFKLANYFKLS